MSLEERAGRAFLHLTSALYDARVLSASARRRTIEARQRRLEEETAASLREGRERANGRPRRSILFVTVDQQRFDALGVTGGTVARTPALDALARAGILYRRAHVPNVTCMPSRSSMLTGQHVRTHGVISNGITLPESAPNIADWLRRQAGYRTALIGKAHFEPHLDPLLRFPENHLAAEGSTGPWRGFEHVELATHGALGGHHYAAFLRREHPELATGFAGVLTGAGGGDTGAPEVKHNRIPRELYHTDWIARRACAWLGEVPKDDPFFCWVSFPDPHHPFDPPLDEVKKRIDHREVPRPPGRPRTRAAIEAALDRKPKHWRMWWDGRFTNPEGGPTAFRPGELSDAQLRETLAMIHVENELIDEAVGAILSRLSALGRLEETDVVYTSDHGELQGDHGLFFKGPYHVDALLRVPLIWRPAPRAGVAPAVVDEPVGHPDLAPTFAAIAGVPPLPGADGAPLPTAPKSGRERVITTFDSQFAQIGMHLRTIYRDGFLATAYERSTRDEGGRFPFYATVWLRGSEIPRYDGSEGELYDVTEDPYQLANRWSDPALRRRREELIADLYVHLPPLAKRLEVDAPT
jgi:arylsulfatase A-like enzyme